MALKRPVCPKCGARHTWIELEEQLVVLRCVCGLRRYLVYVTREGTILEHKVVRQPDVTLPTPGTKVHRCLMSVLRAYPETIYTADVSVMSGLEPKKETPAMLVSLMTKGLIDRVESRSGLTGGSRWKLSAASAKLLDADRRVCRRRMIYEY